MIENVIFPKNIDNYTLNYQKNIFDNFDDLNFNFWNYLNPVHSKKNVVKLNIINTENSVSKFKFNFEKLNQITKNNRLNRMKILKEKRKHKNIKFMYKSRKKIADNRPRIKGRFIKTDTKIISK